MTESVWRFLNLNLFFVKDAVVARELKTSDKFDLVNPETQQVVLECREPEIGGLTKIARAFGGSHDSGAPFNYVGRLSGNEQQAFRVVRGSTTLTFGSVPVEFFDQNNESIGILRKKTFALGMKYGFTGNRQHDSFTLVVKAALLGTDAKILIDDKQVAQMVAPWKQTHAELFKEGKFRYAISIAPETAPNAPIRQVLLGFIVALGRINN